MLGCLKKYSQKLRHDRLILLGMSSHFETQLNIKWCLLKASDNVNNLCGKGSAMLYKCILNDFNVYDEKRDLLIAIDQCRAIYFMRDFLLGAIENLLIRAIKYLCEPQTTPHIFHSCFKKTRDYEISAQLTICLLWSVFPVENGGFFFQNSLKRLPAWIFLLIARVFLLGCDRRRLCRAFICW